MIGLGYECRALNDFDFGSLQQLRAWKAATRFSAGMMRQSAMSTTVMPPGKSSACKALSSSPEEMLRYCPICSDTVVRQLRWQCAEQTGTG